MFIPAFHIVFDNSYFLLNDDDGEKDNREDDHLEIDFFIFLNFF